MPIFGPPKVSGDEQLAGLARVLVRAGALSLDDCRNEVAEAARRDVGDQDARRTAAQLVAEAAEALRRDETGWLPVTDHDRLQAAFAELGDSNIAVLESVEDHWQATSMLRTARERGAPLTGVVWFTAPDVWHAVEHGMLEINVWHGDSANIAEGDELLDRVLAALDRQGLSAHYDEGRVEVAASWQRRRPH